uniref:Non-muscle caldesmon-like n=2 Tax=Nothobranchius furzeri TaxID=105023 RepID=A0A8C6KQA5_NOTFU
MRTTCREGRAATKQRGRGQRQLEDQGKREQLKESSESTEPESGPEPGPRTRSMSESIRRRSSSKQHLQNLIRVTAQRSQEDAEEVERERRRRAREMPRGEPNQNNHLTHNTEHAIGGETQTNFLDLSDEELKLSCLVLEEDEGFSDWSHRLENRNEHKVQGREKKQNCCAPSGPVETKQQEEVEKEHERRSSKEASAQHPEKESASQNTGRTSYSSSAFVSQDTGLQQVARQPVTRMSDLAAGTMKPRNFDQFADLHFGGGACRMDAEVRPEVQAEDEQEGEEVKPSLRRKTTELLQNSGEEDQDEEELSFTLKEEENLYVRREEREEEEEEEQEEEVQNKRLLEARRRRSEEMYSRSSGSLLSGSEGEESLNCYGPMSPTFKKLLIQFYPEEANSRSSADGKCSITERTESLRKSSSSLKKTTSPLPVCKIDKKLEQYAQALEVSSKEGRSSCPVPTDLMGSSEPVASKKNLFEAGEAWSLSVISATSSKDADGLKVGVANLINQWVKGDDGSGSTSPSKPAEIRPGGVLNKKNLWESLGDTMPSMRDGKENSTKKYKFVSLGHGKYTKVSGGNGSSEDANYPEAGPLYDDL